MTHLRIIRSSHFFLLLCIGATRWLHRLEALPKEGSMQAYPLPIARGMEVSCFTCHRHRHLMAMASTCNIAGNSGFIAIRDTSTSRFKELYSFESDTDPEKKRKVHAIAFEPHGTCLTAVGNGGYLKVFTIGKKGYARIMDGEVGTDADLHGACYNPDGTLFATAVWEGNAESKVQVWNRVEASCRSLTWKGELISALYFQGNNTLVSGDQTGKIYIWDLSKSKHACIASFSSLSPNASEFCFPAQTNDYFVSVSSFGLNSGISLFRKKEGEWAYACYLSNKSYIKTICYEPDLSKQVTSLVQGYCRQATSGYIPFSLISIIAKCLYIYATPKLIFSEGFRDEYYEYREVLKTWDAEIGTAQSVRTLFSVGHIDPLYMGYTPDHKRFMLCFGGSMNLLCVWQVELPI